LVSQVYYYQFSKTAGESGPGRAALSG